MSHSSKKTQLLLLFISIGLALFGCASSNVSREAASNVDMGVQNAKNLVGNPDNMNVADSYQNSSQATKGALLGGTTGAVTGLLSSGIGVIPGTAVGAILGASYGTYIDSNATLQDQIDNRGGNVVVLGDQVLIVLPSDRIFNPLTSTIKPQAYSTLNNVAQYINTYRKTLVKISVYTGSNVSEEADLSLSQQQANNVEKVLLSYGVDARLLYAEGYGSTHFVQKNELKWSGNENYRVEITLEKLPA